MADHVQNEVRKMKSKYAEATRKNTTLLEQMTDFTMTQNNLDFVLDLSHHTIVRELSVS